jgi:excisionase family DNA binding protein
MTRVTDSQYQTPAGYLTPMQAMQQLRVSRATVRRMAQDGRLPTYRDSRDKRVRLAMVEDIERLARPVRSRTAVAQGQDLPVRAPRRITAEDLASFESDRCRFRSMLGMIRQARRSSASAE